MKLVRLILGFFFYFTGTSYAEIGFGVSAESKVVNFISLDELSLEERDAHIEAKGLSLASLNNGIWYQAKTTKTIRLTDFSVFVKTESIAAGMTCVEKNDQFIPSPIPLCRLGSGTGEVFKLEFFPVDEDQGIYEIYYTKKGSSRHLGLFQLERLR